MEKSKTLFAFRITRYNVATSLLLIAICAFQPNAVPISSWSIPMWFWLTLPVMYGFYLLSLLLIVKYTCLAILHLLKA